MPLVRWPLLHGRPCVEVMLTLVQSGQPLFRTLLADSGAGSRASGFDLVLDEDDCLLCGNAPGQTVSLGGAYNGTFPVYRVSVAMPALAFQRNLRVVGVPSVPSGFGGIACFAFLNRFTYGNFGDPGQFGLQN